MCAHVALRKSSGAWSRSLLCHAWALLRHMRTSTSRGRCLIGVDVLLSTRVSATDSPQRDRVASWFSRSCTVLTVTGPTLCAMAWPGKASNGTGAANNAVRGARSCWSTVIQGNHLRSKSRSSRWPWMRVGCVTPHGYCTSVPTPWWRHEKKGTSTPARERAPVTGPASRASGGGGLSLWGVGSPSGAHLRAGRNVKWRAQQSAPAVAVARSWSSHREGLSVGVRTTAGRRLSATPTAVGTVWHHEVLHRRLGGKARHGFLYICAESSRLYLRNCSSTSEYAGWRQKTRCTRAKRRVHIAGLLSFRHSRLASALV